MFKRMEDQLIGQAERLAISITIPEEGTYIGSYDKFTSILDKVRDAMWQSLGEAKVILFFKNPEELFRADIRYEGPMRALSSSDISTLTHYDPVELRKILQSRGKTSPFENVFIGVALTDSERSRLKSLSEQLSRILKEPDVSRINLVGKRRIGKTHMLREVNDRMRNVNSVNLQEWQHYRDRMEGVEGFIKRSLDASDSGSVLLIDEAEILLPYPQLWLSIEDLVSARNGKIVYASAKPLSEYLSDPEYLGNERYKNLLQASRGYRKFDINPSIEDVIQAEPAAAVAIPLSTRVVASAP